MIWSSYAPRRWPAAVAIDEMEFRHGRPGKPRGDKAFSVLAAVGYDAVGAGPGRPYVAAIQAVPHANLAAWKDLLESLEGRPGWVVGDGGHPLQAAATTWTRTEDPTEGPDHDLALNLGDDLGDDLAPLMTWRCEWHLARNIAGALPAEIAEDRADRIHRLIGDAVRSAAGWQKLCEELSKRIRRDGTCRGAMNSLLNIRDVVEAQDGIDPHGPRSAGAVEEFFHQLENTIGDRASRLTNKTRTDALLKLIAARRNGWLDETAWAELIREHLAHTQGRAPEQRRHVDHRSTPSLR